MINEIIKFLKEADATRWAEHIKMLEAHNSIWADTQKLLDDLASMTAEEIVANKESIEERAQKSLGFLSGFAGGS